jgi:hypothetical protein
VFLNLAQSRVDILDHDFLDIESLYELTDDGDLVSRHELHAEASARAAFVVFSMKGERLVEEHRANRDSTDESVVALGLADYILHDEWNSTESESPLRFSRDGIREFFGRGASRGSAGFRGSGRSVGERNFAEDPLVPNDSFGGIGQSAPDSVDWRTDRR